MSSSTRRCGRTGCPRSSGTPPAGRPGQRGPRHVDVEGPAPLQRRSRRRRGEGSRGLRSGPGQLQDMRPGCYDPTARIQDMDPDGIHAQLCFPTFAGFAGNTLFAAEDKGLATACVPAYNDWLIDEWCASAPGREIPLVLVPFWDIEPRSEARRVAGKDQRGSRSPRRPTPSASPRSTPTTGTRSSPWPRLPLCPSASTSAAAGRRGSRPVPRSQRRSPCSASTRR